LYPLSFSLPAAGIVAATAVIRHVHVRDPLDLAAAFEVDGNLLSLAKAKREEDNHQIFQVSQFGWYKYCM